MFYILGISQLLMIYVYACLCWEWTLKHMIDEMFCVEQGALEHLIDCWIMLRKKLRSTWVLTFLLSEKLQNIWKYNLELLGISSGVFHVGVEHKLRSIESLAIVFPGVSYKYILAFSVEREIWNCTMSVTPCYKHWVWALVSARGSWKD